MAFSNAPQYSTYQQKRIPFYGDMDSRQNAYSYTTDMLFQNVYSESVVNSLTGEKDLYIRRRPGVVAQEPLGGVGPVRGSLSWETSIFYVQADTLYERVITGGSIPRGIINSSAGPVGMCMVPYQGDNGALHLIISDGTQLWKYRLSGAIFEEFYAGYPSPHIPQPISIDGYIVLALSGTDEIWNTQLSDWTAPWDFISTEMYPDLIQGLNRYNNYIMVLGQESIEMFYNAGIETGSPFARNESTVITIGCTAYRSAVQTDRHFYWVGTTQEGGRSVWTMVDFKAEEIATPFIKRCLDQEPTANNILGAAVRVKGRHWYLLYTTNHTFAYDIDEKKWAVWTLGSGSSPFGYYITGDNGVQGTTFLFGNNYLMNLNPAVGTDAFSDWIYCRWQTNLLDFETMNRKFLHRLSLVGNANNIATISVEWTDDDYQTWSPPRLIPMSSSRPAIVNCGYFRQRGFRFEYYGEPDLRMQAMELTYNVGVN